MLNRDVWRFNSKELKKRCLGEGNLGVPEASTWQAGPGSLPGTVLLPWRTALDSVVQMFCVPLWYQNMLHNFSMLMTIGILHTEISGGFPGGSVVKNLLANAGEMGLIPMSGRSPGRGNWRPPPVFLPGKAHGQRNLAGYSPWSHKRVRYSLTTE